MIIIKNDIFFDKMQQLVWHINESTGMVKKCRFIHLYIYRTGEHDCLVQHENGGYDPVEDGTINIDYSIFITNVQEFCGRMNRSSGGAIEI